MEKILKLLCVFLLGAIFLLPETFAGNIMPLEFAIPDKTLIEDMDTKFYIVINDEEVKKTLNKIEIVFFNESEKQITIPYNGENILEIPFHIPLLISGTSMPISIVGYQKDNFSDKDKHYFRYSTSIKVYKKYPSSILPSLIADKFNDVVIEKKYSYDNQIQASIGDINGKPTSHYLFQGSQSYTDPDNYNNEINSIKKDVEDYLISSPRYESTYNIVSKSIDSKDPNIEKIDYAIGCNYEIYGEETIYYHCQSRILVKARIDPFFSNKSNYLRRAFFYSIFNSRGSPEQASNDRAQYMSETERFVNNIVLANPKDMEYEEGTHSFSASGDLAKKNIPYNYENWNHSSTYEEIMNGGKPEVEKVKKEVNIAKRKFVIKFKYEPKKNIRNTGVIDADSEYATIGFSIDIQGKAFDKDGNEITDVSDEDLFEDTRLICVNEIQDSQLGFKQGSNMVGKIEQKIDSHTMFCDIMSKGPRNYKGPWKKIEAVDIYVASGEYQVSNNLLHIINVDDMTPDIELEKNPKDIQDDAENVFKFKILSEVHKGMKCRIKIPYDRYAKYRIPIFKISQEGQGDENLKHYLDFSCEANKFIPIRIKPPLMGNFDVLGELNKLSMVALQEGTAVTFIGDLVGVGVENQLGKLKKAKDQFQNIYRIGYKNPKVIQNVVKLDKALQTLDKANNAAGYAQDAMKVAQTKTNIEGHIKDTEEAMDIKESKGGLEQVADAGVWGINVLQSAVGAVAMAPKYIPIIGDSAAGKFITKKVGAKFMIAFNLMTNVWKGNLQYISKSEKIDRAQEKKLPIPIIIEIETKEGFIVQDIQIINVLYTWLDE